MEMWGIAGALFGIVFVAVLLHQHLTRPRYAPLPAPTDYSVSMHGGQAGSVRYSDDSGSHEFGWEIGGSGGVAIYISVPSPKEWGIQLPWAAGRRDEVLARIAHEVHRQQCRECGWEITETDIVMFRRQTRA